MATLTLVLMINPSETQHWIWQWAHFRSGGRVELTLHPSNYLRSEWISMPNHQLSQKTIRKINHRMMFTWYLADGVPLVGNMWKKTPLKMTISIVRTDLITKGSGPHITHLSIQTDKSQIKNRVLILPTPSSLVQQSK